MPYVLGIDVGTNRTAAALCRWHDPAWSAVADIPLGARTSTTSSALHLAPDGTVLVGDSAARRALDEPARIVRGFSRRVGDDVPLVVDGEPCSAEELTALVARWVADQVAEQEGAPAEHVVLTHRANWGAHRRGLLHQALRRAGLPPVTLLPEPIAAAESHAAREPVPTGSTLAVYGLGSGTFSAAVVRRTANGVFDLLDSAESADPLGGSHFDDVLFDHLRAELGRGLADLDPTDHEVRIAMARLRDECVLAKERLSTAPEAVVPVLLPWLRTQVRVPRTVFEELARPAVQSTVELLLRTVRASAPRAPQPGAVVLVGGSTRVPLVAELLADALPWQVSTPAAPESALAQGAALAARRLVPGPALPPPTEQTTVLARTTAAEPAAALPAPLPALLTTDPDDEPDDLPPPPRPAIEITPLDLPERRTLASLVPGVKPAVLKAVGAVVVLAGVVVTVLLQSGTSNRPSPLSPPDAGTVRPIVRSQSSTTDKPGAAGPGQTGTAAPNGSGSDGSVQGGSVSGAGTPAPGTGASTPRSGR